MRHTYLCPLRWADLDVLGHVNNVVHVDYLQEARVDMLRTHGRAGSPTDALAEGTVVVRHEVTYVAPLAFGFEPVSIECWVEEIRAASFTMAYEVFTEQPGGARQVYVRARTVLTPYVFSTERPRRLRAEEKQALGAFLEPVEPNPRERVERLPHEGAGRFPVHVRFSDVDVYGHVNNVKYFEYLQEARIRLSVGLWREVEGAPPASMVVARTDVDFRVPILLRPEPYDCWTQVVRVGDRSVTLASEICDGETLLARGRVVLVFFDPETEHSAAPHPLHREQMRRRLLTRRC